jgi:methyl-accepting chemotaxis protein
MNNIYLFILLCILLFILIFSLLLLNKIIGFKPYFDKYHLFTLEKFENSQCSSSNTVDSMRSCFNEVLKGKENYINDLENNLKNTTNKNTSDINTINKQIKDINNSINTIKKNVEDTSNILKSTQNNIYSKANETTEMLQKAQKSKDQVKEESANYQ